jgi:glycerophosphoryl diester phosphodiesterase
VLILGHRGASAHERENTMPAFRRAVADGADGVELDVLLSRDGVVIVFHDEDLRRMAKRDERTSSLTLRELRAILPWVPTLDEVFEELPHHLVNVELKADRLLGARHLVPAVVEAVRRHDRPRDHLIVSSFNPFALAQFRARASRVATGLLFHGKQPLPLRGAWPRRLLRVDAVHPEHRLVTEPAVRRWRREGRTINVWTVDDPAELRRLRALEVDAVITNDPGAARRSVAVVGDDLDRAEG